jgi:hypothetical protein
VLFVSTQSVFSTLAMHTDPVFVLLPSHRLRNGGPIGAVASAAAVATSAASTAMTTLVLVAVFVLATAVLGTVLALTPVSGSGAGT